jgi:hypothetical protein
MKRAHLHRVSSGLFPFRFAELAALLAFNLPATYAPRVALDGIAQAIGWDEKKK